MRPAATVARTSADVAIAGLAREHVIQAIEEALNRGLTTAEDLIIQAAYQGGRAREIIHEGLQNLC